MRGGGSSAPGTDARKVGDLYSSFMDTEQVERLGAAPMHPLLDEIFAATDKAGLSAVLGRRQREGRAALFAEFIATDLEDPSRYVVNLDQAGLGLPDEAYYREEESEQIRTAYVEHLRRLAGTAGLAEPDRIADHVMDLETALAEVSWDQVSNRDAEKTYTLLTRDELRASAPGFDWERWEDALGVPPSAYDEVIVRQPSFVTAAAALWAERPMEQWQAWLALRVASSCADFLSSELVEEDFDFYGRTLSGTPELGERWKRGVALVEASMGEAVGKLYVERHFPPQAKERIEELVATIIEAYRQSISTVDWMSPATRERALDKLSRFTPKVGYPRRWKDYADLAIDRADLLGNVGRAAAWRHDHEYSQDRRPGGPRRVAVDPADGQRLLPPADERDRVPGRDPAAAVLRRRRRRRRQLRRHRRRRSGTRSATASTTRAPATTATATSTTGGRPPTGRSSSRAPRH